MKRKRGRPRVPVTQKASEIVCVRFTPAELRAVKRLARELEVSVSALVKGKLFERIAR